jgi:hypothetical protein
MLTFLIFNLYENISIAGDLNLKFSSISVEEYIPRFLNVNREN